MSSNVKYASKMFTPINSVVAKYNKKHEMAIPINQSNAKIWIMGLIMCISLWLIIISVILGYSGFLKDKKIDDNFSNESHSFIHESMTANNLTSDERMNEIVNYKTKIINLTNDVIKLNETTEYTPSVLQNISVEIKAEPTTTIRPTTEPPMNKTRKAPLKATEKRIVDHLNNLTKYVDDMLNDTHKTQISSPDDGVGTVTTNLNLLRDQANVKPDIPQESYNFDAYFKFKDIPAHLTAFLDKFDIDVKGDYYDKNDYFYSDADAQSFYYDYENKTWTDFVLDRIQDFYDWITTDLTINNQIVSKGNASAILPQILRSINYTLLKGDLGIFILKMKDLYSSNSDMEFNPDRSRKIIANTSSIISFGLLAVDVILLRNLQLMAWDDKSISKNEMLKDPDVFALNSIFMNPYDVRKIYDNIKTKKMIADKISERNSRLMQIMKIEESPDSEVLSTINIGLEVESFISSTMRAGMFLGRAYKDMRNDLEKNDADKKSRGIFRSKTQPEPSKPSEIDCLWNLYCKNLDKATKYEGTYGFLAKLNSIGLRLILGELPLNKVMEALIEETFTHSKQLDCNRIFSKCGHENAAKIILESVVQNSRPIIPKLNRR